MAKEMMIVFVYDTECCQDEADDPVKAVLYFHPSWVSDIQKVSLCGQLMGTTHFLVDTFAARPKIIALQSGKFILKEFGRFILAVGTDRNLPVSILEHRAELLTSLVRFFHRDIQTMHDQFNNVPANGGRDNTTTYKSLSDKLYHIFETYLPILQYNGNIFQNMPISRLPKSSSNIFLDAMHTLQSCQQTKGILGGSILFHNKVIATQLSPELTKNLVLTDPYRIKSTAEPIIVDFHIPVGVQLQIIYIPCGEYRHLSVDSQRAQTVTNATAAAASNPIIPFQFKKKIKRDKSIIFTNIPEESVGENDSNTGGSAVGEGIGLTTDADTDEVSIAVETVPLAVKPLTVRPNHLPLRFKNLTSNDMPESGFSSINFDESDSFPQFIGRTSVCSTPMTEMKVLHGTVLSICANTDQTTPSTVSPPPQPQLNRYVAPVNSVPFKTESRRHSLSSLQDSLKKIRLSVRPFGFGLAKYGELDALPSDNAADDIEIDDLNRKIYRTITDPMYPVFNSAGAPISKCLFQEFLDRHYVRSNDPPATSSSSPSSEEEEMVTADPTNTIDGFDSDMKASPLHELTTPNRVALSLPLKSLAYDGNSTTAPVSNIFELPAHRKKITGIQLTPLMTKLSILAMTDDRSSGFSSWDTTPGGGGGGGGVVAIDHSTPGGSEVITTKPFRRRSSVKFEDVLDLSEAASDRMQRCQLFICGQQNMTMLLIMDDGAASKQELVQSMFDTCVSRLTRIEASLSQTLNVNVDGDKNDCGYSFLSMDPNWDTLQRGGPWSQPDLTTLEFMRSDFKATAGITDMILRTDDSVVYGYQYGQSSIFYKQAGHVKPGLPPPADTIGVIPVAAKRRLERDHSIILL